MSLNLLHHSNLSTLDWNSIIKEIGKRLHFEKNHEHLSTPVSLVREEIEWAFDALDFFLKSLEENHAVFNKEICLLPGQKAELEKIVGLYKGKILSLEELNFLCLLVESYLIGMKEFCGWNLNARFELDSDLLQKIVRLFVRPYRKFVDQEGKIHYERHPRLSAIFNQVNELEQEIRSAMARISRREEYSASLQLGEYDCIYDRYVLPIPTDSYRSTLGPIVAKSSSGKTVYVEPPELRERSNQRIQLLAELEAIMMSLGQEFSEILHPFASEFQVMSNYLLGIDLISGEAQYVIDANLRRPKLAREFKIILEDFFHPLIPQSVKNDLQLDVKQKGLVISGPNTGGKTVALKAIALSHLFIHLGLFVPAREAEIYPISNLYFFSSDEQNLSEGLSSFSSEVKNYLQLLDELGEHNLIIIDEIFSSTSSEEASALAIALLKEIDRIGSSKILLSTHHQVLKTFIHADKQYLSARVGYELEKGPTYKLYTDGPGSSMAFTIFEALEKRFGRLTSVPHEAKHFLDSKQIAYEKLLQELAQKKGELDKMLLENRRLNIELRNQKKSMDGILQLEKDKELQAFKKELERINKEARNILSMAKENKFESMKGMDKSFAKVHSQLHTLEGEDLQEESDDSQVPDNIQIGDVYFSTLFKKEVKVCDLHPNKKEVKVAFRNLTITCPISSLRIAKNVIRKPVTVQVNIQREVVGKLEIDGRGKRLEEFQEMVEKSLQDLTAGEIPMLTIIHGHGEGILKSWLREHLSRSQEFVWRSEDGNDGATLVELA